MQNIHPYFEIVFIPYDQAVQFAVYIYTMTYVILLGQIGLN